LSADHREITWAIGTIGASLAGRHAGVPGVDEVLSRLDQQDLSATAFRHVKPTRLAGCRHLPEAVGEAAMNVAEVAAAIATVEDSLNWRQNPNYSDSAMGQPGYMQNYAYAELIGPTGPFAGDDFLLGVFLLGPGIHYLDHRHAAPELYWVLTGGSEWRRDGARFAGHCAGETIWHDPWVSHATRTGNGPMLAVYAWTCDTHDFARLDS